MTTSLRARFLCPPIVAADLSPGMLDIMKKKRLTNIGPEIVDAIDLKPCRHDTFTHSFSTFMIQFASQPHQALHEMYRVTKPVGILGLCMWKRMCVDDPWQDTVRQFEPDYSYPQTWTPDWADGERLKTCVQDAGFGDVRIKVIQSCWGFKTSDQFVEY